MTPVELRNLAMKLRTITANKQDDVFISLAADEIVKALAEIANLKAQLKSELASHESWQNEHLRIDGEQCRQIRGLEEERDALAKTLADFVPIWKHAVYERDTLKQDAERYQWLREQDHTSPLFCMYGSNGPWGECGHSDIYGELLDESIDEKMKVKS